MTGLRDDAATARRAVVVAGHRGDLDTARSGRHHADGGVREATLGALDRVGALDADDLTLAQHDPDVRVRRRAAELSAQHPDVDLRALLDDPDATVVEMAAWAYGEHEQVADDVIERLAALATGADDALVREAAAAALGAIGDERGLSAILAACADKPAVRRRAVLALAPFIADDASGAVTAAIDAALTDRDWQVRQAAEDLQRALRD